MKRLLAVTAVIALLASMAFAATQDFGKFTMDIPDGWTATQDGASAIIVKNDNTASLSITVAPTGGNSVKDLADAFAAECQKSYAKVDTPAADADGDYVWDMVNNQGVSSRAILSVEGDQYVFILITGAEVAGDEISAMLASFKDK